MQTAASKSCWLIASIATAAILVAGPAVAQQSSARPAVVHVHVADTTGAPLAGVTLTILKTRQQEALYVGTNDATGKYTFQFTPESVSYQIVLRKVGYIQTARLVPVRPGDTLALALQMARLSRELDTVKVTERQLPSKKYFLGADEIMSSTKPIDDAYDAIRELSPVMVMGDGARGCGYVGSVWINGNRWTDLPPITSAVTVNHTPAASRRGGPPPRMMPRAFQFAPPPDPNADPRTVMAILMSIKREHIEQMRYVNCWDTSMPGNGGMDAVFVALKPGIGFDLKRGSYVDSTGGAPPEPR